MSSLRREGLGARGLGVLYRYGSGVGVMGIAVAYGPGGAGVAGLTVSRLRGLGVWLTGPGGLYLGVVVGVIRYGVLTGRCGRGAGVKFALFSLRGRRGVMDGAAMISPGDAGSRYSFNRRGLRCNGVDEGIGV